MCALILLSAVSSCCDVCTSVLLLCAVPSHLLLSSVSTVYCVWDLWCAATDVVGLYMRLYCCTVCRHPMLYFTLLYRSMCTTAIVPPDGYYSIRCAWIINVQCFFCNPVATKVIGFSTSVIYDSLTTSVHTVNSTNTAEEEMSCCCCCRRSAVCTISSSYLMLYCACGVF